MYIEQLDNTRLLITLEQEDLSAFELEPYSISFENSEIKSLLKQLLTLAAIKAGVPIRDKVLSVEALPYDCGCFLLVTIKPKGNRRVYKIKTEPTYTLALIKNADDMLGLLKSLYLKGFSGLCCSLYSYGKAYYLLFKSKLTIRSEVKYMILEYGSLVPSGRLIQARLDENCKIICANSAISEIGSKL